MEYIEEYKDFFYSEKRTMFISGSDKYKIETIIKYVLDNFYDKTILLRTNKTGNIDNMGFPKEYLKKRIAGKKYQIENNSFYFDNMIRQDTWDKYDEIDIAIVYPVDSLCENFQNDCIKNLEDNSQIKKIIYVSWVENKPLTPFFYCDNIVYID